jgi:hypothetical protein
MARLGVPSSSETRCGVSRLEIFPADEGRAPQLLRSRGVMTRDRRFKGSAY